MIENISYSDMLDISKQLEESIKIVEEITTNKDIDELADFISTVQGYSKYLTTTVELYQDADEVISYLAVKK